MPFRKPKGPAHPEDAGTSESDRAAEPINPENRTDLNKAQVYTPWRKRLSIYPAANKYPLLSQGADLIDLGCDIKKNGLMYLATLSSDGQLVDGRNRLDAMEEVGIEVVIDDSMFEWLPPETDLDAWVTSANLFRRHLTLEEKTKKIRALIKANTQKSNLQIAKMAGVSHPTIGKVRAKMEEAGTLKRVSTRTDTKGRRQPARKKASEAAAKAREARDKKITEGNKRAEFLMNCAMARQAAVYTGPVDEKVLNGCRRVAEAWSLLLERIKALDIIAKKDGQ